MHMENAIQHTARGSDETHRQTNLDYYVDSLLYVERFFLSGFSEGTWLLVAFLLSIPPKSDV